MLMNYYPAAGLADGLDLAVEYAAWAGWPMCKLYGVLLTITGEPVGKASKVLVNNSDGTTTLIDSWSGAQVTAVTSSADAFSNKIIGADKVITETNDQGYFELFIVKGLTVSVACPSFGKTITVDTTGQDTIDLSSYF